LLESPKPDAVKTTVGVKLDDGEKESERGSRPEDRRSPDLGKARDGGNARLGVEEMVGVKVASTNVRATQNGVLPAMTVAIGIPTPQRLSTFPAKLPGFGLDEFDHWTVTRYRLPPMSAVFPANWQCVTVVATDAEIAVSVFPMKIESDTTFDPVAKSMPVLDPQAPMHRNAAVREAPAQILTPDPAPAVQAVKFVSATHCGFLSFATDPPAALPGGPQRKIVHSVRFRS
jgi:hypothetical protein